VCSPLFFLVFLVFFCLLHFLSFCLWSVFSCVRLLPFVSACVCSLVLSVFSCVCLLPFAVCRLSCPFFSVFDFVFVFSSDPQLPYIYTTTIASLSFVLSLFFLTLHLYFQMTLNCLIHTQRLSCLCLLSCLFFLFLTLYLYFQMNPPQLPYICTKTIASCIDWDSAISALRELEHIVVQAYP
jgi:hypothetical protein